MDMIGFVECDGGRDAAGYKDQLDCLIRSVAVHLGHGDSDGSTYLKVRLEAIAVTKELNKKARKRLDSFRDWRVLPKLLSALGFTKVKLPKGPKPTWSEAHQRHGNCIVTTNGHVAALKDGRLHDTWDGRTYTYMDDQGFEHTHQRKAASVWVAPGATEARVEAKAGTLDYILDDLKATIKKCDRQDRGHVEELHWTLLQAAEAAKELLAVLPE